jgi:hypothetical protein
MAAWVTGWFAAFTGLLAQAHAVNFDQAHPSANALSAFYLHEGADFIHLAAAFPSWHTLTYTSDGIGTVALIYRLLVLASLLALWHTFIVSARSGRTAAGAATAEALQGQG